ncbi:signal transduction histidine kinase regulating C4-dicarboxylate transport system [Desulfitobacterium dehalogenans ATCC 51507]|uniref:histidine kinase n=1 Tax=Desulfitobacterium dehalogenans (strain ATCC 51507 / DSM 9161 / JW/IU-DC1) TaxID=756499 RepID=I4A4Q0_DESDJ|nr:ATP-binding protein [Desulfitobacterium dehalogenans]AFL98934.1 signal transduction histidine kinase regulating C4-dicarboxylate transport system [Desulfitobacterium dehalogenans ATCC 51507]
MNIPKYAKRFQSIAFKLLAFSIIMSLIPLLFLGGYNLSRAKNYLWESVKYQHSYGTSRVVKEINFLLEEAERAITVLSEANGNILIGHDTKEQERVLYSCLTNLPYVERMSLLDAKGYEITGVSRFDVGGSVTIQEKDVENIFKFIKDYQTYIGPVLLDSHGQPYFQLAIPIILQGNDVKGAIVADISLRSVVDLLSKVSGTSGAYLFLVDQEGHLIGHEDFSQVLSNRNVQASLPFLTEEEEEFTKENPLVRTYVSYTGEKVVGAYAKVSGTDWAVVYEQPETKAFSSYIHLRNTFGLSTLILMLLVLGISLFFVIYFLRQLDILKTGVKRITSGEAGFVLPIQSQDEIGEVLTAFNELSEELKKKRELESALRQADKMASVGLLAAGIAHEINNPMATICLSVEELRYELQKTNSDQPEKEQDIDSYLDLIARQADRCSQITQNLLDFSRQERNQNNAYDFYNLNELIQKALELNHYMLQKKQVQVQYDLDRTIPLIWGDGPGIQQVIFNFLCNSAQAMKPGGVLKLVTENEADCVCLKVIDDGEGINSEDLKRVFEPFFTTKPPGLGTGLGLAVSYGLIKQAGGTIAMASRLGEGTTVTVKLPHTKEVQ